MTRTVIPRAGRRGRAAVVIAAGLTVLAPVAVATTASAGTGPDQAAVNSVAAADSAADTPSPRATAYPIPSDAVFVSPSGSDSAPGTEAQPLRTLAAAIGKVPAGGTIVMRGGVYREGLGGVNKRITVQPYPNENVQLKGSDVITAWTRDGNYWRATSWTSPLCQTCYHEDAIDPDAPLAGRPDQVFRNGTPLEQVGRPEELGPGKFYVDETTKALYVGDNPSGAVIEASSRWRAMLLNPSAAGSVIRGLTFTEYAPHWNEDQLAVLIVNAPDSVIENNVFTRSAGRSLGVFNTGVKVIGNQVVDNGGAGANFNRAHNVVVEGNTFSRNNTAGFDTKTCGSVCTIAGLKMAHTANPTVRNNVFADNKGTGYWCDLGCTDGVITGNTVVNNAPNGIYWEVSSRATISDNRIEGNERGIKVSGSDHVTITNNRFSGNAIQLGVYDDPRSPSSDSYSAGLGLTWDTTDTVITANTIAGTSKTTLLLETNRTAQVNAAQMIGRATDNSVSGNQTIHWCPSSTCTRYTTIAAFASATGIPFGTVTSTPPTNHLTDPGFEANPPVWGTFGPATVLTPVSTARTGAQALQIATTGTPPVTAGATSPSPQLRTVAGRTYTASCWVRSASRITARIRVQEYTPNWQAVTGPTESAGVTLADPNTWYQVTLTHTATTSDNLLPLSVFSHNLTPGGPTLLVDDCTLNG
ncbi:right-handed parallel beta-helix repeat-containing protein [Micromonospora sp. HM5-17]|uniref:right-handed parallel beta-helix repeat-containing protein n=1 Tax=Micromonospora sp. HM5-17 TaxID=2487710 RepID=UPI0011CDBD95|nr:right-handed parallel beta-helix repeat-containing protein [Micromonospora sp. HM5-17]